ncbi:hypothetical protein NIES21_29760 [Anabaenopsis circularis NIES-21]|uniref:Uncharacterized protein n=2 Tax=Nostocales TaxID=1161 RepID=A0A1Z4GI00_9CYAN|nr:hypothetical protein [Nostoc cycadae]BAY17141.1 hypothetical protein NIES21_29760 [Anabaenopsis circularis NIES-21]GBE92086.1 alpha-amylase [Nostoc cycadae WK-1]
MPELPLENLSTPIYIQIVSQTPGRLRLRISPQHQEKAEIQLIANYLKVFFPQIDQVKVNSQTGSITIYTPAENSNFAEIIDKLQAQGLVIITPGEKSQPVKLTQTLFKFNQQVTNITKESVDLRVIIPFTVVAIVLKRLLPPLARWKTTTLYLLLWYGLESLVKLSDKKKPPTDE